MMLTQKDCSGGRLEEVDFDVERVLLGQLVHAREGGFDGFDDGRDLDAGVGAEDGDGFLALVGRDGQDCVKHERREHRGILAATVADEPRARVVEVELAQRIFDFLIRRGCHWREYVELRGCIQVGSSKARQAGCRQTIPRSVKTLPTSPLTRA